VIAVERSKWIKGVGKQIKLAPNDRANPHKMEEGWGKENRSGSIQMTESGISPGYQRTPLMCQHATYRREGLHQNPKGQTEDHVSEFRVEER